MRELKLKYFIDLVSNVGARSKADAVLMQQAQAVMNAAITGTNSKFLDYSKLSLLAGKNTALMKEVITGATDKFAALDRAMTRVGQNTGVERQLTYMQALAGSLDRVKARAAGAGEALKRGFETVPQRVAAGGAAYYGGARVVGAPIKAYSDLESATEDLRIAMTDAKGKVTKDFDRISAEAVKLGNELPGTTKDFMRSARALSTQGVPTSVVANGGLRASAYVGVLLDQNQEQAAEVIAKLREAHGLKDNELVPMADLVQRAFFGFGIKPQEYLETAKYAASTYNTMGITGLGQARETLAIQGMAANVGLEASSFGTNYSQMLRRTAQIEARENKNSKEAKEVKALLGEHGISMRFYDDKGVFGGNVNMLQQLAKLRALNPLEQMKVLDKLFGVEAGRPAQIMVQKGLEGYNAALATIDSQGNLDQRIAIKMDTFASKLEALGGTITNVMAAIAAQTAQGAKPAMDRANSLIGGPVQGFFDKHPAAGTATLLGGGAIGAWLSGMLGRSLFNTFTGRGAAAAAAGAAEGAGAGAAAAGGMSTSLAALGGMARRLPLVSLGYELFGTSEGDLQVIRNAESLRSGNPGRSRGLGAAAVAGGTPAQFDYLRFTAPGQGTSALPVGALTELKLGEGKLDINVRVSDERVTASSSVMQPLSLVRINPGNTNPAGYTGGPR